MALLRYLSHTIKLPLKYIIYCFYHIHRIIQLSLLANFRTFSIVLKETPPTFTPIFSFPSCQSPLIYFLFVQIFLLYAFHINTCPSVSVPFHLACFQGSSMLQFISIFYSFTWLNNIALYRYTIFCLSAHQFMEIWIISTFRYCEQCFYVSFYTSFVQTFFFKLLLITSLKQAYFRHIFISLGYIARSGIAGSYDNSYV